MVERSAIGYAKRFPAPVFVPGSGDNRIECEHSFRQREFL